MVKNPPANEGGPGDAGFISSLGPKDPLEKEMPTHSSILAGKFHRQRSLAVTKSRKQVSTHRWLTNTLKDVQHESLLEKCKSKLQ